MTPEQVAEDVVLEWLAISRYSQACPVTERQRLVRDMTRALTTYAATVRKATWNEAEQELWRCTSGCATKHIEAFRHRAEEKE